MLYYQSFGDHLAFYWNRRRIVTVSRDGSTITYKKATWHGRMINCRESIRSAIGIITDLHYNANKTATKWDWR